MKVAVLLGGISKERDVSLRSGEAVCGALSRKGHEVIRLDVKDTGFIDELCRLKPDCVYLALHGRYGEDGTMQGVLEWLQLPYTGSSVLSSSLCFDKLATKQFLAPCGVRTPAFEVIRKTDDLKTWCQTFSMPLPVIVKPNTEGSTIGISRVFNKEELLPALVRALNYDSVVLVEQYIEGRELTVSVLDSLVLPVIEIIPDSGFYDYTSKYTKGKTRYEVPAKLSPAVTQELQQTALKAYKMMQCEGAVRADFILDAKEQPWFLEINTLPGMTETSLLPKAAASVGIDFDELCDRMIKTAKLKLARTFA